MGIGRKEPSMIDDDLEKSSCIATNILTGLGLRDVDIKGFIDIRLSRRLYGIDKETVPHSPFLSENLSQVAGHACLILGKDMIGNAGSLDAQPLFSWFRGLTDGRDRIQIDEHPSHRP